MTDDKESVGGRPDPASFTPRGLHLTLGETEVSVCRINAQHGGSPAGLLLLSTFFLARKDDNKGWSRQPAGTGQTRSWRGQGIVLPEVASVALATGASKNLPRDSPGSSGPGSFLVAQQYEDIKKSIYQHKWSFSLLFLLCLELDAVQSSPDLRVSVHLCVTPGGNECLMRGTV